MQWEEEPVQRWMDLSGMQEANNKIICGIGILNDCKYSACMEGNCMELTVLRSPVYAHHNPYILDEEEDDYQLQTREYRTSLIPSYHTWAAAERRIWCSVQKNSISPVLQ